MIHGYIICDDNVRMGAMLWHVYVAIVLQMKCIKSCFKYLHCVSVFFFFLSQTVV